MKRPLSILFAMVLSIFLVISCDDDDSSACYTSESGWRLVEFWSDPGDLSGEFVAVDSDQFIDLDSTSYRIFINENVCESFHASGGPIEGTWDPATGIVQFEACDTRNYYLSYEEGDLWLWHPCIEPCVGKYRWERKPE